jgi:hypothetical protein
MKMFSQALLYISHQGARGSSIRYQIKGRKVHLHQVFLAEEWRRSISKDIVYIDPWHSTPFSLGWLVAEGNLTERGLAQPTGSGIKKGCILSGSEFDRFLAVKWNSVGAAGQSCTDPVNWGFPFSKGSCWRGGGGVIYENAGIEYSGFVPLPGGHLIFNHIEVLSI